MGSEAVVSSLEADKGFSERNGGVRSCRFSCEVNISFSASAVMLVRNLKFGLQPVVYTYMKDKPKDPTPLAFPKLT